MNWTNRAVSLGVGSLLLGALNACTASTDMGSEAYDRDEQIGEARESSSDRRLDRIDTVSPSAGSWGTWRQDLFCNPEMWAIGYNLRVEPSQGEDGDDTALNAVSLLCQTRDGAFSEWITSFDGLWGSWGNAAFCPNAGNFLTSARMRVELPQGHDGDDTGANDVEFGCLGGGSIRANPGGPWGDWSDWAFCSPGTAVCGLSIRFEDYQGTDGDDTAMNGMKIHCCRL